METLSERIRAYEQSEVWRWRAWQFVCRYGNACAACGTTGGRQVVDVHHRTYKRAFYGQEPDADLRALCRWHHDLVHQYTAALEARFGFGKLAFATDVIIAEARSGGGCAPAVVRRRRPRRATRMRIRRGLRAAFAAAVRAW